MYNMSKMAEKNYGIYACKCSIAVQKGQNMFENYLYSGEALNLYILCAQKIIHYEDISCCVPN